MSGNFFHFPIKLGEVLTQLPLSVKAKIFYDYLATNTAKLLKKKPDDSFETWVRNRFGDTLYRLFFGDYTEKTWGMPCSQISVDWAEQRIGALSITDAVKKSIFKPEKVSGDEIRVFYYPRTGGAGLISERYGQQIRAQGGEIHLTAELRKIVHDGGRVSSVEYWVSGQLKEVDGFDYLLTTIPITDVVGMLEPAPPAEVLEAANKLRYRACVFVFLVVEKSSLTHDHWIYLPEKEFAANRITEFKNYSPQASTPEQTVVSLEITCDFQDEVWSMGEDELVELGRKDLVRAGLATESEISDGFIHKAKNCYPLYTLDYKKNLNILNGYLSTISNLRVFGRNGVFVCNNMDHSMDLGLKVADSVLGKGVDVQTLLKQQEWEK